MSNNRLLLESLVLVSLAVTLIAYSRLRNNYWKISWTDSNFMYSKCVKLELYNYK